MWTNVSRSLVLIVARVRYRGRLCAPVDCNARDTHDQASQPDTQEDRRARRNKRNTGAPADRVFERDVMVRHAQAIRN